MLSRACTSRSLHLLALLGWLMLAMTPLTALAMAGNHPPATTGMAHCPHGGDHPAAHAGAGASSCHCPPASCVALATPSPAILAVPHALAGAARDVHVATQPFEPPLRPPQS